MQRIKHHYCWVKAMAVPAGGDPDAEASHAQALATLSAGTIQIGLPQDPTATASSLPTTSRPGASAQGMPFSATGHFHALEQVPWPLVSPETVARMLAQPASATGSFSALVDSPLPAVPAGSLNQMLPLSATGHFRVLSDAPVPAVAVDALPPGDLPPPAATVMALTGKMFAAQATGQGSITSATGPIQSIVDDPLPPMMFAGASFMGAWQVEQDFTVPPSVTLHFMPVVGSRQDALLWRYEGPGQEWAKGALAVSLLSFAAIGEI